ncbi:hypothetical protein BASA62_009834 [Batrachochytrium salamandrivorans]|nr:hypothetical protein BASA62_009834 [Batrachochytrium salamandrivorans]
MNNMNNMDITGYIRARRPSQAASTSPASPPHLPPLATSQYNVRHKHQLPAQLLKPLPKSNSSQAGSGRSTISCTSSLSVGRPLSPSTPVHCQRPVSSGKANRTHHTTNVPTGTGRRVPVDSTIQLHDRAIRKAMDLEISNTSLLSVNSALERTVRQQSIVIKQLKKQLTRLCNQSLDEKTLLAFTETQGDEDVHVISPQIEIPPPDPIILGPIDVALDRVCDLVQSILNDGLKAAECATVVPTQAYEELDIVGGSGMFYHMPVGQASTMRGVGYTPPVPNGASPDILKVPSTAYLDDPYLPTMPREHSLEAHGFALPSIQCPYVEESVIG